MTENLELRVQALEAKQAKREGIAYYEKKILEAARNYASMAAMGKFLDDNGCINTVGFHDREMYAENFLITLKRYASDLFAEQAFQAVGP